MADDSFMFFERQVQESDPSTNWIYKITVLFNFVLIQTVGNVLTIAIIHYEKWGGDPKKRSLSNQLLSFCFLTGLIASIINQNIYLFRAMCGPQERHWATLFMSVRTIMSTSAAFAGVQILIHRSFQLFYWSTSTRIHDDWFAAYLILVNVMLSLIWTLIRVMGNRYDGNQLFLYLSGIRRYTEVNSTNMTVLAIYGLMGALAMVAAVLILWKKNIETRRHSLQSQNQVSLAMMELPRIEVTNADDDNFAITFNNCDKNKPIGSASLLVLIVVTTFLWYLPAVILSNFGFHSGWIGVLARDVPIQFGIGFFIPFLFIQWCPEIKCHMNKIFWDHAPEWVQYYNPDHVLPFQ